MYLISIYAFFGSGIYVARYMKGVTTKWFVIHVVYQSIGVAVILTGTLTRNLN
jgi:hypothetical protein